jgi:hypothetical protein
MRVKRVTLAFVVRRLAAFSLVACSAAAGAETHADAVVLRVRVRDATPAARGVAPEPGAAADALAGLYDDSWLEERWTLAGASASVTLLGGDHPLPDAARVVITESGDRADVVRGAQTRSLPPRLLGDLFEGARTRRTGYSVVRDGPADAAAVEPGVWRLGLRQQSRTGGWHRMVTTRFTVWHRPATSDEAARARLALDLVALPHLGPEGRLVLRREGARVGVPLRWRVEVEDESLAGRHATPVLEGEVVEVMSATVPATIFATGPARFEAVPHDAGGLVPDGGRFARLRPSAGGAGPLHVRNETAFYLYVLVDGALAARVGPHGGVEVTGLSAGYYRLYARTRHGTFAWGPRDQYVPGTLTVSPP